MEVYGLAGKSGTGKSFNASALGSRLGVEAMIDDGLYIYCGNIAAGRSSKKENSRIKAVRNALFDDDVLRDEVRGAIDQTKPGKLLVLGTSDKMIHMICERLDIPQPVSIIEIEEITTPEQRELALKSRNEGGIHTIPAPTFEVKKQFSGYFIDARKAFRKQDDEDDQDQDERTIVRPTYSYLGGFEISEKVISDIVELTASSMEGVDSVVWSASDNSDEGMYIRVILMFRRGARVTRIAREMQEAIEEAVSSMTAFNILGIDVEARGFHN